MKINTRGGVLAILLCCGGPVDAVIPGRNLCEWDDITKARLLRVMAFIYTSLNDAVEQHLDESSAYFPPGAFHIHSVH